VHRAGLAEEAGAEPLEDSFDRYQRLPEPARRIGVVTGVHPVVDEGDGVGDLDGDRPDRGAHAELAEHAHDVGVEVGHRPGLEWHGPLLAVDSGDIETVGDEVEVDLERPTARVRHQRGREAAGRHVERRVPPVVGQRLVREPDLADHLGVEVQGVSGLAPPRHGDGGPSIDCRCGH
jgi:hypothetical protein